MSRRALEQQQARAYKKQQERVLAGIYVPKPPAEVGCSLSHVGFRSHSLLAVQDPPNIFPYKCDRTNMDMGHVLYSNIVENQYFIDRCA
jgi:hypothetical protein